MDPLRPGRIGPGNGAALQAGFDDSLARVAFDLGGDTGEVHIAGVRLLAFDTTIARRGAYYPAVKP